MRGALSLALALSLPSAFPYRQQILAMTFAIVVFTIVVQGLAIKPLLRSLETTTIRCVDAVMRRPPQAVTQSARKARKPSGG